jgi:hypothetical protein
MLDTFTLNRSCVQFETVRGSCYAVLVESNEFVGTEFRDVLQTSLVQREPYSTGRNLTAVLQYEHRPGTEFRRGG